MSRGESELTLKLAYLYMLFGILLIRDRSSENIDIMYLHLIDGLDRFNSYEWGRVVYDFLVSETHGARDMHDGLVASDRKIAFDVHGLVFCHSSVGVRGDAIFG